MHESHTADVQIVDRMKELKFTFVSIRFICNNEVSGFPRNLFSHIETLAVKDFLLFLHSFR